MRSKASVNIEFGLLNVPVQVCLGTKKGEDDVHLTRVSAKTKAPFKQQYVDDKGNVLGKDVKAVRGVQTDKGFVVIPDDKLNAIEQMTKTTSLKIDRFEDQDQVPKELYRGFNYLQPQKGSERAFGLLYRAMKETHTCALVKWTPRTRQQVLCIRPDDDRKALIAHELFFANEVRDPDAKVTDPCKVDPDKDELELAKKLITDMVEEGFDYSAYQDDRNVEYEKLVTDAVNGKAPEAAEEEPAEEAKPASDIKKLLEGSLKS